MANESEPSRLVIHYHPVPDSLSGALFDATVEGLTASDGTPPSTAQLSRGDAPTADDLHSVSTLAFVYPTWWGGLPASLLDWVQRCLGPWIDGSPADRSPIASVSTLVAVTTHGSPELMNRITGEPGRQLWKRSVKPLAAPNCSWHWLSYYGLDADNAATRTAFVDELPERLRDITNG